MIYTYEQKQKAMQIVNMDRKYRLKIKLVLFTILLLLFGLTNLINKNVFKKLTSFISCEATSINISANTTTDKYLAYMRLHNIMLNDIVAKEKEDLKLDNESYMKNHTKIMKFIIEQQKLNWDYIFSEQPQDMR